MQVPFHKIADEPGRSKALLRTVHPEVAMPLYWVTALQCSEGILELKSSDDGAVARQLDRTHRAGVAKTRVQPAESCRVLARHFVCGLCCQRVRKCRILHARSVKNVAEFRADVQSGTFLDSERPPERQVLDGTALKTIVVIVSSRGTPLARGRLLPCVLIEHEGFIGVIAMAIDIDRVQGHAGLAVRECRLRGRLPPADISSDAGGRLHVAEEQ